jgi:hypothetical protein
VTVQRSVLALEFRGVGDTADFSFLARENGSARLVRVDPIVHHVAAPLTVAEQARLLVERQQCPPDLVLAYCGAAALGLHVADLTGATALLVDPYPITERDLRRDFARLCASMDIDPGALDEAIRSVDLARWDAVLLTRRDSMAQEHGGDEEAYEAVDGLFDRYRAWLSFLFASAASKPASPKGAVVAITAQTSLALAPLLVDPPRTVVHRVTHRGALLDSPLVRRLILAAVHPQGDE